MERENKLAPEYFSVSVYIKFGCCLEKKCDCIYSFSCVLIIFTYFVEGNNLKISRGILLRISGVGFNTKT